jgi:hypothetical protein
MKTRIWFARLLITPVIFFNLQCSLVFLITPGRYAASFDLHEPPGLYMIQGLGLLFLMWNIPYLVALHNPKIHSISLIESIIMQTIGVLGETILLNAIPPTYSMLHTSIIRFIIFDASGLILLILASIILQVKPCPTKP